MGLPKNQKGKITFIDLFAGFPCQPFSMAGGLTGLKHEKGDMFKYIMKIIKFRKPDCILLENVKNLVFFNKGEEFNAMLNALRDQFYIVKRAMQLAFQ